MFTEAGVDRRFYELCTLAELKNALRSGDIWVEGSRQFKDFDDVPGAGRATSRRSNRPATCRCPWAPTADTFLQRATAVARTSNSATVNRLAHADELPDAIITEAGLKITPLANAVPEAADALMQQAYGLLPHVKITELLHGGGRLDGFHPALHPHQERRRRPRTRRCC